MAKQPLQRATLPRALTELTLAVQRTSRVGEALEVAAAGLEAVGLDVAIVQRVGERYRLQHTTTRPGLIELAAALSEDFPLATSQSLSRFITSDRAQFLEDLPAAVRAWLPSGGAPPEALGLTNALQRCAVVAPLTVDRGPWGVLLLMQDELEASDAPLLSLFALQVGSALGIVDRAERLDRRTAELELVHRLAVSSSRANLKELCQQALETVCRLTASDAGALHRFERDGGRYVLVGDVFGYRGPLVETWREFTPRDGVGAPGSFDVSALPSGAELVRAEGFEQAAVVPLRREEQSVGMLSLFRRTPRPYAEADVRSAEILGLQMASLLERQRLYQDSQRLYADLKASYDELARAQAELVRHERLAALGELAAVMAHEVRNPLGVIFNSLTTLKRLTHPTGDAEMLLNMVGEEADRLNRIVADLLDFARPYELVKKPIAIEPFLAGAVDAATQTLQSSVPVKVVTSFERELPPFPVDAHLMRQALINLVVNAAQAMPRGGLITVSARVERKGSTPWLVIEVCDEGLGLTARATEKIFQPFFTTKATGTGLGLAVVKRIVDSHGGEVTARPNPDRGTTFVLRLPGGTEREGVLTPPRPSPSSPRR